MTKQLWCAPNLFKVTRAFLYLECLAFQLLTNSWQTNDPHSWLRSNAPIALLCSQFMLLHSHHLSPSHGVPSFRFLCRSNEMLRILISPNQYVFCHLLLISIVFPLVIWHQQHGPELSVWQKKGATVGFSLDNRQHIYRFCIS